MAMTQEEANVALAAKVAEFNKALSEAEAIADEHGLSFRISPAYGMGGRYEGDENDREYSDDGWHPSSQSC